MERTSVYTTDDLNEIIRVYKELGWNLKSQNNEAAILNKGSERREYILDSKYNPDDGPESPFHLTY